MQLNYLPAGMEDYSYIIDLFKSAVLHMQELGIDQWDDIYPDEKVIEEDIKKGHFY